MEIAVLDIKSIGEGLDYGPLEALGNVTFYDYTASNQVSERLEGVDIVISNKIVYDQLTIKGAKKLKLICMTGTGYNNIDLEAAVIAGIGVCNVKDYCTQSVAQHTFAMVLHLLHNLSYYQDYVSGGDYVGDDSFKHYEVTYRELGALRWGVIGMGNIGRRVAMLAETFGSEVVYYSTSGKNTNQDYKRVELEVLLKTCDIITIHAPLNDLTYDLIDHKAIKQMKKEAIIVNVGRGGIINEADICEAIMEERIGGLGVDVFTCEPMEASSPYVQIVNHNKALITPHVAWASIEARQRVIQEVALNIKAFESGEKRNRVEG